jgi:hypothetical protein
MKARHVIAAVTATATLAACSPNSGKAVAPASPEGAPSISTAGPEHTDLHGFAIGDAWFGLSQEQMAHQGVLAKAVGANAIRFDADLGRLSPDNDRKYTWDEFDTMNRTTRTVGSAVITIAYVPERTRDPNCVKIRANNDQDPFVCPPAWPEAGQPDPYGVFAGDLATHLVETKLDDGTPMAANVADFEVWNEQNNDEIPPDRYAAMLIEASKNIRAHIPHARIVFGGMAPNAETKDGFYSAAAYVLAVNKVLRDKGHDPKDIYDAIAFHPYGYPAKPDQPYPWNGMTQLEGAPGVSGVQVLYDAMKADGIGDMDVLLDEYGAPTCGQDSKATETNQHWDDFTDKSYVDYKLQNDMLAQFIHWRSSKGMRITGRFVHTLKDKDSSSKDREDCFGVYDDKEQLKTPGFSLVS